MANQSPPPPPPDPNQEPEEYFNAEEQYSRSESQLPRGKTSVANTGGKNFVVIGIGLCLAGFLVYQVFLSDEQASNLPPPPVTAQQTGGGASVAPPTELPEIVTPVQPPLPPPPPPPAPVPVEQELPLPPTPPVVDPNIEFTGQGPTNERELQRRQSSMLIVGGVSKGNVEGGSGASQTGVIPIDASNPNAAFAERINNTSAANAIATTVGDLNSLVLQGKILDAVLETAIDTTLPGPLRAVVSRDVYAESGNQVLVPKGSRLIGTYNTDVVQGQARVFIIWSRLIRPDGIDVEIGSQAIDRLGRSGIPGYLDDRYFEIFGGAILTSVMGIALAGIADAVLDPEPTTTTNNTDGSVTSSGSALDTSISEAVGNVTGVASDIVGNLVNTSPVITVDQGTPVKVFVNRDLKFSNTLLSQVQIIQ